jgi:signal transduction histidine kinase/CheY-like chemotaxis protein
MTTLLRILEEWIVHQDYVWFVVVLAWGGVLYSVLWFARDQPDREARWAMAMLAVAGGLDAGFELALGLFDAGRNFAAVADFLGGLSGAIWAASLARMALSAEVKTGTAAQATRTRWPARVAIGVMTAALLLLGIARFSRPVAGSVLLLVCAGAAGLGLARQLQLGRALPRMQTRERAWLAGGQAACVAALGAALWEPRNYWPLGEPFPLSRFTLPAASCQLLAAALFGHAWLVYGLQSRPPESYLRTPAFRSELRIAGWALAGWLSLVCVTDGWRARFWGTRFPTFLFATLGAVFWALVFGHRLQTLERTRALERAELAAHANRARSAFLSQVSHELRAPLQALLGFAELLALAPLAEPHRSRAGALRTQGALLLRLVNDLLDLGAIQSGVFRLSCGPTDLRRVMAESVDPLRPRAEHRGLELWTEVEAGLPAWIESDGARLRQVIFNLVGNAIKYTDRSRIGATLRAVLRPGHGPELELRVTDTGPGLPQERPSGIFQPYARFDNRAEAEGLGLGLSLAQSICHALGGTLEVENDERNGATFVARWPLKPCAAPPGATTAQPPPKTADHVAPLAGLRVLVADDNSAVREMLGAFLRDQGCLIEMTSDGGAALVRAQTGGHDVMLLDLSMPQLDGCTVVRTLRRDEPPGRHLLVVGLSAYADAADSERALAAGMDGFMAKPVELAQLVALLVRLRHAMAVAPAAWQMPAPLRRQLCALFAAEWPELRVALHAACDAGDRTTLQSRAHYLKNSADVLGDDELRELCHRLQDAAQAGNEATIHALVDAIDRAGTRLALAAKTAAHLPPPDSAAGFSPGRP